MSIINSFDPNSSEIINPARSIEKIAGFPETVLVTFSQKFADLICSSYKTEQVSEMSGGRQIPICQLSYKDKSIGFYHTLLGGSASGALLEEVIAKGAKKVLFFGSCGSLDKSITSGKLMIPSAAYRDEGTSYHYAPASDYIRIPTSEKLAHIFDDIHVPYTLTKTWTTDSFYRETQKNMAERRKDGCCVVEMECASIMAVGQFRGIEVYQFLYTADCLDGNNWDKRILGNMPNHMRERILKVALEAVIRL